VGLYAYLAAGTLQIIDISNPSAPVVVALSDISAVDVAVVERRAYVAAGIDGLRIVDVSNPAIPREVGSYSIPQGVAGRVVVKDGYAYVSWGRCFVYALGVICSGGIEVVSIADPTPVRVGGYGGGSWAWGMAIVGSHVYLAHGLRGVRIVDISTTAFPTEIGFYNTPFYGQDVAALNGYLYVADDEGGMFVLRLSAAIAGRVSDVNGVPFAGVQLAAGPNLTTTSDTAGNYSFSKLSAGIYTLRPTLSGYAFYPPSSTVTIPPEASQNFIIVPAPRSLTLTPGSTASLIYTDTQGLATRLSFPASAVSQTITLTVTPTLAGQRPGFAFAGHAFELTATQAGAAVPNFSFSRPVTATIRYSNLDVRVVSDEQQLQVWQRTASSWLNAAQSCAPPSAYVRDIANNTLSVAICRAGLFSLFGPTQQQYLPQVAQN
jgi:Carboxypeptidase regulatory-like domain/LVIVD repeat